MRTCPPRTATLCTCPWWVGGCLMFTTTNPNVSLTHVNRPISSASTNVQIGFLFSAPVTETMRQANSFELDGMDFMVGMGERDHAAPSTSLCVTKLSGHGPLSAMYVTPCECSSWSTTRLITRAQPCAVGGQVVYCVVVVGLWALRTISRNQPLALTPSQLSWCEQSLTRRSETSTATLSVREFIAFAGRVPYCAAQINPGSQLSTDGNTKTARPISCMSCRRASWSMRRSCFSSSHPALSWTGWSGTDRD